MTHDSDTSANFTRLQGYRWMSQPDWSTNRFVDARIRNAVDDELMRKGFRPAQGRTSSSCDADAGELPA